MEIQKVISKLEHYEEQLNEIKPHHTKKNKELMYNIRGKIKSIIMELYSEEEIKKLFQGIFHPFYFAPSEEFAFFDRDIENCLGGIQIIKDNYDLGKFDKNKEITPKKEFPNINITNTNLNQINNTVNSFKSVYKILENNDYKNKEQIKKIIKEIEEESKKENIQKKKIKKLLDRLKSIGGEFLKQVPIKVITDLITKGFLGGL